MAERVTLPGEKACEYVAAIGNLVQTLSIPANDKKVLLDAVTVLARYFNC